MTAWSGIGYYECLTRQDIEDNIQNGTFTRLSTFTVDNKLVTKAEVSAYISFTPNASFNAKTSNQIIIKGDINAGGITPPPTPTPTPASFPNRYYVRKLNADCTLTLTYIYADLGAGINPPTVNQYVTLSEVSGCYVVVSIDQSNSVTATINAVYPTSCTCTAALLTLSYGTNGFQTCLGVPSAYQTLTISGVYLTDNIIITGPSQLEFSLNPTTNYVANLTLTPSSGTVSPTTVYFRLTGAYTYAPTGLTIDITSTGASPLNLSSAAAYTIASPSITSTTPGSRVGTGTVTLSATVTTSATVDWYAASTGGTALATGTLSFTTPSISTTTTYYIQARDTSGNNCTPASSTRTAVIATITAPPVPAPLVGTLGTSIVFWGSLSALAYGGFSWVENGPYTANIPTIQGGSTSPYSVNTDYMYFDGSNTKLFFPNRQYLTNAPLEGSRNFTLMSYGNFSNDGTTRILWSQEYNSSGWGIKFEPSSPAGLRFTISENNYNTYILIPSANQSSMFTNIGSNRGILCTFVFSSYTSGFNTYTYVEIYFNDVKIGDSYTVSNIRWGAGYLNSGHLMFSDGASGIYSGGATYYKGDIRYMLMYNTTLTQPQISSIYQYLAGNTPTSTSTNTGGSTNSTGTGTFYTLY